MNVILSAEPYASCASEMGLHGTHMNSHHTSVITDLVYLHFWINLNV